MLFDSLLEITPTRRESSTLQTPQGTIKEEFIRYYDEKYGVWVNYSPSMIDPFSVQPEYRASVLGYYFKHPTEALNEFIEDEKPDPKKTKRALQAMMWRWAEIDRQKKKEFLESYDKKIGMTTLLMFGKENMATMALVLILSGEEVDLGDLLMCAIVMGMSNKGPTAYQEHIHRLAEQSVQFQEAIHCIDSKLKSGQSISEIKWEIAHNLDKSSIPKFSM